MATEHINRIELQGRVGNVRSNEYNGRKVQNFSLMTECIFKKKDGGSFVETTWHQVSAWQKQEVQQGDLVRVQGRLRCVKYTGADGTDKIMTEVLANEVELVTIGDLPEE